MQPGDLIHANIAGKVIASNNPEYKVGEFVNGSLGVQNFAISDGNDLEKCNTDLAPLGSWLGGFGVSGLTAYFALFDECKPQPGQTVLVTGAAGAVGDIGSHAMHLIEFITGLKLQSVAADLSTFVEGRKLDDDASILIRMNEGVKGSLSISCLLYTSPSPRD